MTTIIIAENTDIYMDEQTSLNVVVNTVNSDGTPRDITGGAVTWKAFANGVEMIKKDTPTMLVMLAPVTSTLVTSTANTGQNTIILDQVAGFGTDSWCLFALVLAVIQVGTSLVIVPVIIYLFTTGNPLFAGLWSVYFVIVIFSDNVLKPWLLGKGAEVPMLVIFIGVLGGFFLSGFIGLFTGAIVLSIGYKLFLVWLHDQVEEKEL